MTAVFSKPQQPGDPVRIVAHVTSEHWINLDEKRLAEVRDSLSLDGDASIEDIEGALSENEDLIWELTDGNRTWIEDREAEVIMIGYPR